MTTRGTERVVLAATAAAGLGLYVWFRKRTSSKHSIPKELLASPYKNEVKLAVKLALKAGNNMYKYCDNKGTLSELGLDLDFKGQPEDFCTQIDVENETLVMRGIQKVFPNHEIIGEETTGQGPIPKLTDRPTWIIDPIDGTTNFASGLPLTCVSIGYCVDSEPTLGVVYAPMTDELYVAVKGHGAFRNGKRIMAPQDKKLTDAVVVFEFGYVRKKAGIAKLVKAVQKILEHGCRTTRSIGSGVLDLCYVATGRVDVVYSGIDSEGWKPWDYCAGAVIVKEANCVLEAIGGKLFDLYSDSIICGVGPTVVKEIRQVINQ